MLQSLHKNYYNQTYRLIDKIQSVVTKDAVCGILDKYKGKSFPEKRKELVLLLQKFRRIFYMAGVRHYINCEGKDCTEAIEITRGDEIILKIEKDNTYDKNAVQMFDAVGRLLGYIPRYYSQGVSALLDRGENIVCHIYDVDKNKNCNECVKVIMKTE